MSRTLEEVSKALSDLVGALADMSNYVEDLYLEVQSISRHQQRRLVGNGRDKELDDLYVDFDYLRVLHRDEHMEFLGDKIPGKTRNGAWAGNGAFYFKYRRPSGAIWFLPNKGSSGRYPNRFSLVAPIAKKKLADEIAWVKKGKPPRQNWNV